MNTKKQINWHNIFFLLKYEFQNILPSLKKAIIFLIIFYILVYIAAVYQETPQSFGDQVSFISLIVVGSLLIKSTYKTLFSKEKVHSVLMLPSSNVEKVLSKAIISFLFVLLFFPLFNFIFTLIGGIICVSILKLPFSLFNPFQHGYLSFINSFLIFVPFVLLIGIYCKKYTLGRILCFVGLAVLIISFFWFTKEFIISISIPGQVSPAFTSIFNFVTNHPNIYNFINYYQWIVSAPLLWSLYYLEFKKMEA